MDLCFLLWFHVFLMKSTKVLSSPLFAIPENHGFVADSLLYWVYLHAMGWLTISTLLLGCCRRMKQATNYHEGISAVTCFRKSQRGNRCTLWLLWMCFLFLCLYTDESFTSSLKDGKHGNDYRQSCPGCQCVCFPSMLECACNLMNKNLIPFYGMWDATLRSEEECTYFFFSRIIKGMASWSRCMNNSGFLLLHEKGVNNLHLPWTVNFCGLNLFNTNS